MGKQQMIGKQVTVVIDRPLGSPHPTHNDMIYSVNYGYIEGLMAGDGEEQDAYVLGVPTPLSTFEGVVVAIIHRLNDREDKWVVAPPDLPLTKEDIQRAVWFCEQYFDTEIIM